MAQFGYNNSNLNNAATPAPALPGNITPINPLDPTGAPPAGNLPPPVLNPTTPTPGPVIPPPAEPPETDPYNPNRPRPDRPHYDQHNPPWKGWDHDHPRRTYGNGTKMLEYLYWKRFAPKQKEEGDPVQELPLYTAHPEALKQALAILGVQSERNPMGLALDMDMAREVWFGAEKAKDLSDVDEAEFRAQMEQGDPAIDRKRIRQFINYDGSATFEVLNPDKSVMARFTMGTHKDQKVFVTGGYDAYAQQLKKLAEQKTIATQSVADQFEQIRKMYARG